MARPANSGGDRFGLSIYLIFAQVIFLFKLYSLFSVLYHLQISRSHGGNTCANKKQLLTSPPKKKTGVAFFVVVEMRIPSTKTSTSTKTASQKIPIVHLCLKLLKGHLFEVKVRREKFGKSQIFYRQFTKVLQPIFPPKYGITYYLSIQIRGS